MIYPIEPRTRSVVASRFRAGDSVELLAEDYGISPEQVEAALREEWTPSFAEAEARAAAEGACDCAESEVARLRGLLSEERATSARLRGLLRDMEYVHFTNGLASLCPACYLTPGMGHSVDCRLAAALEEEP